MAYEMKGEISLAPIDRILHLEGGERVSSTAVEALRDFVEAYARVVASEACKLANHAGRITVKKEDVLLAARTVNAQLTLRV